MIDGHIKVTVVEIRGDKIRLSIEAAKGCRRWREEPCPPEPRDERENWRWFERGTSIHVPPTAGSRL